MLFVYSKYYSKIVVVFENLAARKQTTQSIRHVCVCACVWENEKRKF